MLEHVPYGQIIFLNGTSSSGKTSIAEELLEQLPTPYFYIPFDALNAMRSRSRTRELTPSVRNVALDETRLGHLRAVAGMAKEGNNVIIDQVLSQRSWLLDAVRIFEPFDVLFVGVRCSLPELERREKLRGDRDAGQAARQFPSVHRYGEYDVECDTEMSSSAECARRVIDGLNSGVRLSVFSKVRSSTENEIRLGGDKVEVVSRVGRDPQYEVFADEFLDHASDGLFNAHYDRPACLDLLGDVRGLRVLDAACGPGLYAEEFVKRGAIVTGFDQSPRMVELARQRVPAGEFRVHDLADPLDWLENESFDLVLLALAIEYVDDRVEALKELRRVLSPSGALVFSRNHPTADWLRNGGSYFDVRVIEETWSKGWHLRYWLAPLEQTCEEIHEAGFLIDRIVEPKPSPGAESIDATQFARLQSAPGFIAFRVVPAVV